MFICPTCNRSFLDEDQLVKHFLACWKEKNPNHKSKDAPRGPDVETRAVNEDIQSFFERGAVCKKLQ